MSTANDLAVVEMTNTSDRPLAVILTLGGVARTVATLARGATIVLVSPEGASWSFEPAPAGAGNATFSDDDQGGSKGGKAGLHGAEESPFSDDDDQDGSKGGKSGIH